MYIMKPILCFYMGYSEGFNGVNYNTKNVYGSEINAIKLAEQLTDIYDIYIFVSISEEEEVIHNKIHYLSLLKVNHFRKIDIMIVVRYINYFIYFKNIAKNTFIWVCDTIINPAYDGLLIENTATNFIYNIRKNINGIIGLSTWHLENIQNTIDTSFFPLYLIYNPIDLSYYKSDKSITKNKFIYMSDPNRGLTILLDCLIYIQKYIPDISLTVFRSHDFNDTIKNKIKLLNNTTIYGKESQEKIADECLSAEYFFYPTNFPETFCNCAAEAQLYHCVCIYNNIGGLSSTIDNRGLQINYSIDDSNYVENTCNDVMKLMKDEKTKKDYLYKGHKWAKQLDIKYIKDKWIELFSKHIS